MSGWLVHWSREPSARERVCGSGDAPGRSEPARFAAGDDMTDWSAHRGKEGRGGTARKPPRAPSLYCRAVATLIRLGVGLWQYGVNAGGVPATLGINAPEGRGAKLPTRHKHGTHTNGTATSYTLDTFSREYTHKQTQTKTSTKRDQTKYGAGSRRGAALYDVVLRTVSEPIHTTDRRTCGSRFDA